MKATIKERNQKAFDSMKARHKDILERSQISMSMSDLVDYTNAVALITDYRDFAENSQLACFLMEDVGTCCKSVKRYETILTGDIDQVLSDWDNRYEMGK